MCVVKTGAEHEFLACLEALKSDSQGWVAAYFSVFELKFDLHTAATVTQARSADAGMGEHDALVSGLEQAASALTKRHIFQFTDGDVIFLGYAGTNKNFDSLKDTLEKISEGSDIRYASIDLLQNEFYTYQKRANEKMLSARMYEAYEKMADVSRVSSIVARRRLREEPLVLMIEDDRFSGSYAANILLKNYDLILCKTGEEGISNYIEHAPDIVFIDIHLPGINGHQTLEAIKSVDPEAFAIMLSADTVKENVMQASKGGAKNFLKKPFSKERLVQAVQASPYIRGEEGVCGKIIIRNPYIKA